MRIPSLLLLGSLTLTACGGGGGVAPVSASRAAISFPSSGAVTDAGSVRVRGTTAGQDAVAEVTVNGIPATSADGFRTWEAIVPLQAGANDLVVGIVDDKGLRRSDAAAVRVRQVGTLLDSPARIAVEQPGSGWLIADRDRAAILRVLADGSASVVADRDRGQGPPIETTSALVYDFGADRIYSADDRLGFVLDIDPMTGNRRILSNGNNATAAGLAGIFSRVTALVHDPANARLLAADAGSDTVYSIAIPGGDIRLISGGSNASAALQRGAGPDMFEVEGIALDEPGNRAIVADSERDRILAIDLTNGNRQILSANSSPTQGSGPDFESPSDLVLDASRQFAYVTDRGDPATRAACGESSMTTLFAANNGGAIGGAVYFNLTVQNPVELNCLDLNTGRDPGTPISATIHIHQSIDDWQMLVGSTANLAGPWEAVAVANGSAAGINNPSRATLTRPLSLQPGRYLMAVSGDFNHRYTNGTGSNQTYSDTNLTFSGGVASSVPFEGRLFNPRVLNARFGYMPAGGMASPPALLRVNLATGARSTVAAPGTGTGVDLAGPAGVALDPATGRAMLGDPLLGSLVAVDLEPASAGNRALLASPLAGSGPRLDRPQAGIFDSRRQRLLVLDSGRQALLSVEPATGQRTVLAAFDAGVVPQDLALDSVADIVLVLDHQAGALLAVDPASGSVSEIPLEGPSLRYATAIAVDEGSRRAVVSSPQGAGNPPALLLAVDLDNSQPTAGNPNVTVLSRSSGQQVGSGPELAWIEDLVVDAAGMRVLVAQHDGNGGDGRLLAVDLATGDRTVLAGANQGSGPELQSVAGLALGTMASQALVTTEGGASVLAVDLATGDRRLLAGTGQGQGPALLRCRAVVWASRGAFLLDRMRRAVLALETGSGDRVITSK